MSDFKTVYPNLANLDPSKRVSYTHGLVLGVDEFMQEQYYLLNKDRSHNSLLHGYGTVCGLQVTLQDGDNGPEVKITPGAAVDPLGREIKVKLTQCARLNDWLGREENRADIEQRLLNSPPELSLFVVLCYRECPTDLVPIPGGPCQSLEDSSTASRIMDAFDLSLRFVPPKQREEWAVRLLGILFKRIEIVDDLDTLEQDQLPELVRAIPELVEQLATDSEAGNLPNAMIFEQLITALIEDLLSEGSPPVINSPADTSLRLNPDDADGFINNAMLVWVTEVRPQVHAGQCCTGSVAEDEECLLLARLEFGIEEVDSLFRVAGTEEDWVLDQTDRPYLLHSRLIQEWSLFARNGTALNSLGLGEADEPGEGGVIEVPLPFDRLDFDPISGLDGRPLININTATREELEALPLIGPRLAQRIIDFRTDNDLFGSVDQLTDVEGISINSLNQIRDLITV